MMNRVYTGRETSWLKFNERVLNEALDDANPLLEQLRFLSIFSTNLDEYFMIRVSGIYSQTKLRMTEIDIKSGMLPREYINDILKTTQKLVKKQYEIYKEKINALHEHIHFTTYKALTDNQKKRMTSYFHNFIYPVLTPIRFSPYLPFPLLPNLSVYIISMLKDKDDRISYSVVTVPKNIKRVVQVKKDTFILLEDLIVEHMAYIYKGIEVVEAYPFRITRDFDIEYNDQSDDFAVSVTQELKNRKRGAAVRIEIDTHVSDDVITFLNTHLKLPKKHVFLVDGPVDLSFLSELYDIVKDRTRGLIYDHQTPVEPEVFLKPSIMEVMDKKEIILLHPHHSYDPVVRLMVEAANDPDVVAIKQTIYRTNKDSRIMSTLVKAAEAGKQVTVLFELRARFDEENNLHWGSELERVGAHVIYGVPDLKTHSKLMLIVKNSNDGVKTYVHFSTGNYNENNAKIYTDVSLFTTDEVIGSDVIQFFNYISSYTAKPDYKKLIASPYSIKEMFIHNVRKEIKNQEKYKNGHIIVKINSLTDIEVMNELIKASQKGVRIDMIIRSICCLIPGIEGFSENIHVKSIVGRYLEHMRIYYFHANGKEDVFITSADLMTRNMERRIETALPVTNEDSKQLLIKLLNLQLSDNVKSYVNHMDEYEKVKPGNHKPLNSQLALFEYIK